MSDKVLFDPGFAPFVENFSASIDIVHQVLASLKNFNQKKMRYRLFQPQLLQLIKNNIAFYKGCLMWAYFIHNSNFEMPKKIEGNMFFGMPKNELENYDFSQEIDFIIAYFETYERDSKYYLAKSSIIPEEWKIISNLYKEFVSINAGFVNVSDTSQVELPKSLNFDESLDEINNIIEKSISDGKIELLLTSFHIAS